MLPKGIITGADPSPLVKVAVPSPLSTKLEESGILPTCVAVFQLKAALVLVSTAGTWVLAAIALTIVWRLVPAAKGVPSTVILEVVTTSPLSKLSTVVELTPFTTVVISLVVGLKETVFVVGPPEPPVPQVSLQSPTNKPVHGSI